MRTACLAAASATSAAAALAIEFAVVRIGAPHLGQSLLPWSAAIVAVLCGLALGHALGGRAGGADAGPARLRAALATAWAVASAGALLMPTLAAPVIAVLSGPEGPDTAALVGLAALAVPSSIAAGFALPLLLRLAVAGAADGAPRRVAAILAGSASGSVAGTALAGFVLLETLGATGLARLLAIAWLLLAAAIAPWRSLRTTQRRGGALAMVGATTALALVALPDPCDVDTRYTCIRLFDRVLPEGGVLRFMMLDEGVHSASDRDAPTRLHLGYAALADRLARPVLSHSSTPRALVIGGGGATLPRARAAAIPGARIVVAELDGRVATTAARTMWADSPAIETRIGDGRAVLRAMPAVPSFDVVLMDAYRTQSVPPHLVTREHAALVRARLAPGGVYLSNVIDRAGSMQLAAAVATTLSAIFPRVEIWVPEDAAGELTNAVVAAWTDAGPTSLAALDLPVTLLDVDGGARGARPATFAHRTRIWEDALAAEALDPEDLRDALAERVAALEEERRQDRALRRLEARDRDGRASTDATRAGVTGLATIDRHCLGQVLRSCRVSAAGVVMAPDGRTRVLWQMQEGIGTNDRAHAGIVLLAPARDGWRPIGWSFEAHTYEAPRLFARVDGLLLHVRGLAGGTGTANADLLYRLTGGIWSEIETESWQATLSGRLPAGLGLRQAVAYDFGQLVATARLWRTRDANCCPRGGQVTIDFNIEGQHLRLAGLGLDDVARD